MIKLYYATHTCALASHIALEEAAAEYETVRISFATKNSASRNISPSIPRGAFRRWSPTREY